MHPPHDIRRSRGHAPETDTRYYQVLGSQVMAGSGLLRGGIMVESSDRRDAIRALQGRLDEFDFSRLTNSRVHILRVFLELATREGYSSASMRTLAKELDIKAPSLYSHFPGGRDEMVSAALMWHHNGFYSAVLGALVDAETPDEAWDTIISVHVRRQLMMPEYDMIDLLIASDRHSGVLQDDVRTTLIQLHSLYSALFETTAREMGYSTGVEDAVAMIVSFLDGVSSWSRWDGSIETVDEIVVKATAVSRSILDVQARLEVSSR